MNRWNRIRGIAFLLTLALSPASPAQDAGEAAKKMLEAYNGGRYEEVVKLAEDFIKTNPQSPNLASAQLLLARSQYSLGKWGEAISSYRKVQASAKEHKNKHTPKGAKE